ncbi:MAG: hypothetical protein ABTA23_02220, partial [Solibacillus sp.]
MALLENRVFLALELVFIGFQGSYGMPRHCYIRTFFSLLENRSDILELLVFRQYFGQTLRDFFCYRPSVALLF